MFHKLIEHAMVIFIAFNSIALGESIEHCGLSKKSIYRLVWVIFLFVLFLALTHNDKGGNQK